MFPTRKLKAAAYPTAIAATLMASNATAWVWNMPEGVTETSQDVYGLHMLIFWICCAIGVLVFGAMAYSMFAHRKSKGAQAASFHESTAVEIVWTVVPFAILIAMAIPSTKVLLALADTSESDITVKVTGFQWKWRYDYVDDGFGFYSTLDSKSNEVRQLGSGLDPVADKGENYLLDVDHPLVIPAGKKVRFLLTANDVVHSWWVPEFGWKKDAIPGFINEAWTKVDEPGTYRGVCAELCGRDHGFMPIVVEVKSEADYAQWLAEQKAANKVAALTN